MFYHFRLSKNPPLSHASLSVAILFDISQVVLFFYFETHVYFMSWNQFPPCKIDINSSKYQDFQ